MNWYLIHTKPRQEKIALQNLQRQDYECYLPILKSQKLQHGVLMVADEPLFPRYLFIRLGRDGQGKSWSPIRSTKGVSKLVSFGGEPARVDDILIEELRAYEHDDAGILRPLFKLGERIEFKEGAFAGIEGVFQMSVGESRVIVLIELLSKSVKVAVAPSSLKKVA